MRINALQAISETSYPNLTFDHTDIAHVIVSNDDEVLEVHDTLRARFSNLNSKDMALLLSKVNSFEGLSNDW